jgi:ubiquinone/menaquinone biosynthesis C-methylase UbiE
MLFSHWRRYLPSAPRYLAQHYWWAYLSPRGVWFFGHDFIVSLILLGQYQKILHEVMRLHMKKQCKRTLQLACAYGAISPTLALAPNTGEFHLTDAANIQLIATQSKLQKASSSAIMARMNAESLAYATNSFDCVVIFFLLHELPADARERALGEAIRTLKPAGTLLIAEYGENLGQHLLHRFTPWRWVQEKLEPFLHNFWHSNLSEQIVNVITQQGKSVSQHSEIAIFGGYYRVIEYRV